MIPIPHRSFGCIAIGRNLDELSSYRNMSTCVRFWFACMHFFHFESHHTSIRIVLVKDMGFCWNANNSRWIFVTCNWCNTQERIWALYGTPQSYAPYRLLGEWVLAPQNCLQMGTLSEERVVKLNEIGFTCEVRRSPKRSGIDFVFTSCFCLSMVVQEIY